MKPWNKILVYDSFVSATQTQEHTHTHTPTRTYTHTLFSCYDVNERFTSRVEDDLLSCSINTWEARISISQQL